MHWKIYLQILAVIFIFMYILFILAQMLRNNSIVDIFWGIGFIVIVACLSAWARTYMEGERVILAKHLVNACVLVWGARLSVYIFIRNGGKGEDWRYKNFRKKWGEYQMLGAFLQVFMLQGIIMFIVSLPVIHVNRNFSGINFLTCFGFLIWMIGFLFEAIGDLQMYQFKKDPLNKDKAMQYGLWKYTRHPNYFGEIVLWWGIWIMSFNIFASLQTFVGLLSPIMMTFLLTKVSGVPMLEKKLKEKNEAYREYIRKTPALFPKFR